MKLYYVSQNVRDGRTVWLVEAPSQASREFALRTHATEWAKQQAAKGWTTKAHAARILLLHEDGQWRLEAAFEAPSDSTTMARVKRPRFFESLGSRG